jgi:DNA-binding transcriptional ArsR family regulator
MTDKTIYLFKALGEETKHRILRCLLNGEMCACKIPSKIGRTQSNTSMHLAKLAKWGLVKSRRDGKMVMYSIKDKRVNKIFELIKKSKR